MTSENSTPISTQMRDLIIRYMEACNKGDNVSADALLDAIKERGVYERKETNS